MKQSLIPSIAKELRQFRWTIIIYCLIALGFVWMYMAIFPSFAKESAKFNELVASYPKALLEAFNIKEMSIGTLEGFLSTEHFSFVWPIMAILLVVSMSGRALAGEIERGTIALLLALPLPRLKIFASKYIAGLLALLAFCATSILSIIPLAIAMNISINSSHVWLTFVYGFLFGWVVFSAGMMLSSLAKERSTVYITLGGSLLIMYVMNLISGLVSSLEKLQYGSIFYYFVPSETLINGKINSVSVLVMILTILIFSCIGAVAFKRRDISV